MQDCHRKDTGSRGREDRGILGKYSALPTWPESSDKWGWSHTFYLIISLASSSAITSVWPRSTTHPIWAHVLIHRSRDKMSTSQSCEEANIRKYMWEPLLHARHSINVDYMKKHLISQTTGCRVRQWLLGPTPDPHSPVGWQYLFLVLTTVPLWGVGTS